MPAQRAAPVAGRRPPGGGALTKRTSLDLPPQIPLNEWSRIGHDISVVSESSTWWLGDWLIYGQSQYPDRYLHAISETLLDYQTLRNYAWVARQYSAGRRRPNLSFQHHAELASLSEDQQDLWLDRAEKFGWSRNELRNRVRANRKAASAAEGARAREAVLSIEMNVPADRKQRWLDAATSTRQDLLTWIVAILDDAADTIAGAARGELSPDDDHLAGGRPPAGTGQPQSMP